MPLTNIYIVFPKVLHVESHRGIINCDNVSFVHLFLKALPTTINRVASPNYRYGSHNLNHVIATMIVVTVQKVDNILVIDMFLIPG